MDRGNRDDPKRCDGAGVSVRATGLVTVLIAALLGSEACSTSVDSTIHDAGSKDAETEDAGQAQGYCNAEFGIVRLHSKFAVGVPGVCAGDDICALDEDQYICCDPSQRPNCGVDPQAPLSNSVYCSTGGLDRYSGTPPGPICKANEICAMHKNDDCGASCCDPMADPDCGVPLQKCSLP